MRFLDLNMRKRTFKSHKNNPNELENMWNVQVQRLLRNGGVRKNTSKYRQVFLVDNRRDSQAGLDPAHVVAHASRAVDHLDPFG